MPVSDNEISFMLHSYQQVDAAVDQVEVNTAAITDLQTSKADASALIAATNRLTAALADILDSTGAKNRLSVNSGTTGSGNGYFVQDLPITLEPGDYVWKMTRTGDTSTSFVVRAADDTELARITRGAGVTDIVSEFSISGKAAKVSIYVGYSVTITDAMICSAAAYAVSNAYAPYAPTNAELYAMILAGSAVSANSLRQTAQLTATPNDTGTEGETK